MISNHQEVDVFLGVDVGKGEHHAVAGDRTGQKLYDKALPNDEAKLRTVIDTLARHGRILFAVDQPATIDALPVAVSQACGVTVGYLSVGDAPALFLSSFAALKDPLSRTYYDRKRAEGKRHNRALIALTRRRCDVIYAMLRDGTLYEAKMPVAA